LFAANAAFSKLINPRQVGRKYNNEILKINVANRDPQQKVLSFYPRENIGDGCSSIEKIFQGALISYTLMEGFVVIQHVK